MSIVGIVVLLYRGPYLVLTGNEGNKNKQLQSFMIEVADGKTSKNLTGNNAKIVALNTEYRAAA